MKTLSMRDLNRQTARVLDALERGENFEIHRNGKAVGYLTHTAPPSEPKLDWKAHPGCDGSRKRAARLCWQSLRKIAAGYAPAKRLSEICDETRR
jgi:antitoxin (DNA-binding transcriptional repressor) of toxin-antitoxin stability system